MSCILYIYGKCSTCQKAVRFLEQNHISFESREIVKTPPSLDELRLMLQYRDNDVRKLFNTSGLLYRELQLSEKLPQMALDEALHLLHHNGMLVKRPFLLGENFGFVGFREAQWEVIKSEACL